MPIATMIAEGLRSVRSAGGDLSLKNGVPTRLPTTKAATIIKSPRIAKRICEVR